MNSLDPLGHVPGKRATLRTVAEACGLAVTTVSRALNNHSDIAIETRHRVQRVASEIGYVPDRAGRGLRTGRSHLISLLVPSHAAISGYTSSIILGLGQVCRDQGFELAATPVYSERDELDTIHAIVANRRADGIILSRIAPQDQRVRYLLEHGFPFVTHGRTELATPHAWVDFNNRQFTEWATERLAERGCRRVALIAPPAGLTYTEHMTLGFHGSALRLNLSVIDLPANVSIEMPLDELKAFFRQILKTDQAPDGVVCGSELAALAVSSAVREAGLRADRDVMLVSKQTSMALDYVHPPIDACVEDIAETGRVLGKALLQVIAGGSADDIPQRVIEPLRQWKDQQRQLRQYP